MDSKQVKATGRPKPPNAGKGRKAGSPNKTTKALKEAILEAAELVGHDGNGGDGLTGYLKTLAVSEPRAFAGLLGRVLPLQVTGEGGGPIRITRVELVALGDNGAN